MSTADPKGDTQIQTNLVARKSKENETLIFVFVMQTLQT